jgi:quercetin dioxygenase-like cupin family protein
MDQEQDVILLKPGQGRSYALGDMRAVFKADEAETGARYSISEWWLEPGCAGPGAHSHEANDEIFYVLAGEPSILTGDHWNILTVGSFIRIPAGVVHDFRNNGEVIAGLLNVFTPGGFERNMPEIVAWFEQNPPAGK